MKNNLLEKITLKEIEGMNLSPGTPIEIIFNISKSTPWGFSEKEPWRCTNEPYKIIGYFKEITKIGSGGIQYKEFELAKGERDYSECASIEFIQNLRPLEYKGVSREETQKTS